MSSKVYWKSQILFLDLTRRYIQRNQLRLQSNLTADQYECVVAVLNAILTCLASLPVNDPT